MKGLRSAPAMALAVALGAAQIGWISNAVSGVSLEIRAARELVRQAPVGYRFYVLGDWASPLNNACLQWLLFRGAGGRPRIYSGPVGSRFDGFPWFSVGVSRSWIPFFITFKKGLCLAPLAGEGDETHYVCFFGYCHDLHRGTRWVS